MCIGDFACKRRRLGPVATPRDNVTACYTGQETRMGEQRKLGMKIEGEPSKRYGVSYGGQIVGSYNTAKEALEAYRKYEDLIRPVTDRDKKYRYAFRDGRTQITMEQLRCAATAEEGLTKARPIRTNRQKRAAKR